VQDPTQPALYVTNVAITDDTRGSTIRIHNHVSRRFLRKLTASLEFQCLEHARRFRKLFGECSLVRSKLCVTLNMQSAIPAALHGSERPDSLRPMGHVPPTTHTQRSHAGTFIDHGGPLRDRQFVAGHQWGKLHLATRSVDMVMEIQLASDSFPAAPFKSSPVQYMLYLSRTTRAPSYKSLRLR